jgi:glycosyltransferase involved in cell wall biosynthesis
MHTWCGQVILLIDYTCVRKESHNWDSLLKFRDEILRQTDNEVVVCIPSETPFPNTNEREVYPLSCNPFERQLSGRSHSLGIFEFFKSAFVVYRTTKLLITQKKPSKLIWVNAEAPSLLAGIFLSITRRETRFYFRFIGWTEFWTPLDPVLLRFIFRVSRLRKNISLAYETKKLNDHFGGYGTVVPYPITLKSRTNPVPKRNILLLGSARQEKGFNEMVEFAKGLKETLPDYTLTLQEAVTPWENYSTTLDELSSLANVILAPAYLERLKLNAMINECRLIILPYDRGQYALKGSASLFEAVELRKPVIAYRDCGFSDDVEYFYLGLLADNVSDLVLRVQFLENSKIKNFGFDNYALHSNDSLRKWMSS